MISYHANNDYPVHKLCEIVGNSEKIIKEHYLKLDIERLTSSPPYSVEGGDSKDRSLGFLFPRVDLLEGVTSLKYWSVSPEALVPV